MKGIEKLIEDFGWHLGVSDYRYGDGFFVFVAPSIEHIQNFNGLANMPGDIAATDFYFYVDEEGSWLPIVHESSLEKGMDSLNKKLNKHITYEWLEKVETAYNTIDEVTNNSYGLDVKVRGKMKELFE